MKKILSYTVALFVLTFVFCATTMATQERNLIKIYDQFNEPITCEQTLCVAKLERGSGFFQKTVYTLVIENNGELNKKFDIDARLNGWTLSGQLIYNAPVGYLIVDPATGSLWTLHPQVVELDETRQSMLTQNGEGLYVLNKSTLPEAWLDKMQPVNL